MSSTSVAIKEFATHFAKSSNAEDLLDLMQHPTMPVFLATNAVAQPVSLPSTLLDSLVPPREAQVLISSLTTQETADDKKPRKKPVRDPNMPKRPPSAFLEYQNHVRADVRAANTDTPYQDIMKLIAANWAAIDPVEKAVRSFIIS